MYCTQCGTKLPDDAKVCPNCNTSFTPDEEVKVNEPEIQAASQPEIQVEPQQEAPQVPEMQPQAEPEAMPQQETAQEAPQNIPPQMANGGFDPMTGAPIPAPAPKEKKPLLKNKLFLGLMAGAAVLLIAIIIVVIIVLQPKKVNVDQYVSIDYNGYDGYATADVYLDEYGLYYAIMEAKGQRFTDYSFDDYTDLLGNGITVASCIDSIELSLNKEDHIANGDELVATITYNNEMANEIDIEFVGETVTITAGGLEPVAEVDPFDGLNVTFSGISPYGYVEYEYVGDNEYVESYYFNVSQWDDLKNGDTVTITYDTTDENTLWSGYVATTKTKDYEVTGLDEYADTYSDFTADFITKLQDEAEDTIYAYIANSYSSNKSVSNLEYAGYIFSAANDSENYHWYTNSIYVIYKGDVTNADKGITKKVYYPVCFRDVLIQGETMSYDYKEGIEGYCYVEDVEMWTDGYVNPLSCYIELVANNQEEYNAELGDGFEEFASYTNISTLEDISADYKTTLQTEAKAIVEKYIADDYSDTTEVKDLALIGEYLLVAKEQGSDFAKNNRYIAVYSATVSNKDNKFEPTTVYYPVLYYGVVALPNGEYMTMECEGLQGNWTRIGESSYYTDGYLDGAKMFSDLVTANRESYSYIVSEGLKQFGE